MGLLRFIIKLFKCKSKCSFNEDEFIEKKLDSIDLSKYKLKKNDMIAIEKIVRKRPSINTYLRENTLRVYDIFEI
tara:strand:+ start:2212 stop:2436 length:225 start_codon:yes stop_codon:yes gene_type:complete